MSDRHFLWNFFEPKSIAIIGVRSTPGFGYQLPVWLIKRGFGDKLYLVNPKGGTMHGLPLYKSISELPRSIDLAIIITPAPAVPKVLEELGGIGVKNVIIESAGFAETGIEGARLQARCKLVADKLGLKVMGPNCVGVVNTENKFATSEAIEEAFAPGGIGLVAQSGVFGSILLDSFPSRGLKISRAITLGNRLVIDECDALDFFASDPMTRVVALYLEGASDGKRLRESLARICRIKPVIVLKSGRTAEGVSATASHTGSIAGEDAIYDALFAQTGAVRAPDVASMIDYVSVFDSQPLPQGNRICILTTSGSMGAVAIDASIRAGLNSAKLSLDTLAKVRQNAPPWMNVKNPLDVGPSGVFRFAFEAVLDDPSVDMVLMFATVPYSVVEAFRPLGMTAQAWLGPLGELRKRAPQKPVVLSVLGHPDWRKMLSEMADGIAMVEYPEGGARALSALWKYSQFRRDIQ